MQETRYGLRVELPVGYDAAVERATAALKSQGFGVLTTIDVQQTLKQKLDRDFRRYVILGACNPPLADRALHAELEVGLLLPCNVIVYETTPGRTVVAAMAPLAALGIVGDNAELQRVAEEADARLRAALASLESTPTA
ncbi:MAG: ABC transporter ATP-binding protein [Acidobacteria bacterium RIFCSPLOWO2_12_FULL_67_14]|nr:MAG: ABC transporter ATP-binding protein [Acidobacteria bacterium RIFCSPLOWO2_02_FULL_67_21]OFW39140.1 MAG: ABC transporter ATP-binding protein [Acidobacteria bacterium RIFCSPLOWO2_12_FULL_67_14]